MHYTVNRETLRQLACEIMSLASIEGYTCNHKNGGNALHDGNS